MMLFEIDFLKMILMFLRKKYYYDGDGRRILFYVRGFEVYMIEVEDKWEVELFLNIFKLELVFLMLSDNQGLVFYVYLQIRMVLLQYLFYRYYVVVVVVVVLRKVFVRMNVVGGLSLVILVVMVLSMFKMGVKRLVVGYLLLFFVGGIILELLFDGEVVRFFV